MIRPRFSAKVAVVGAVVVLLVAGGFVYLAVGRGSDNGDNSEADSIMQSLSHDPSAAENYFDPGSSGSNKVLDALLIRNSGASAVLATRAPKVPAFPGYATIGDALNAATQDVNDPASRRIASEEVDVLGSRGYLPAALEPQMTELMVRFISSGHVSSGDVNGAFGNDNLGLFIPQDLTSVLIKLSQDPTQYRLLNGAELGHLAQTIQSYVPQSSSDGDTVFNYDMDSSGTLLGVFSRGMSEGLASAKAAQAAEDSDYSAIRQFVDNAIKANPYLNNPNSDPVGRVLMAFSNEADSLAPLPSSP